MATDADISQLLLAPVSPQTGAALMEWAKSIPGRVTRGDMMLGILSIDEVANMPDALLKAADCGHGEALLMLGRWFANPAYGESEPVRAEETLRLAIAKDIPGAGVALASQQWFNRRDEATEAQRTEAYELVRRHLAEDATDANAIYLLGLLTHGGFGTRADAAAALELQNRAADLGHAGAMFEIYAILSSGSGVAKDEKAGFAALQRAAEAGNSRALYNMGAYCAMGKFVPKSLATAALWYERAADAGNPRATANLAMMYARGEGVAKDMQKAALLFDEAEYSGVDVTELRESVEL